MNDIIRYCQLAFQTHKVIVGDQLIPGIQRKTVHLVVFSSMVGRNRLKKIKNKCTYYHISWMELDASDFDRITRRNIQSFGITDRKLAEQLIEKG